MARKADGRSGVWPAMAERRTDTISSLQRTARLHAARDEAHYRVLRAGEVLTRRRAVPRRAVFGTMVAVALLVVVLTATAVAERTPEGADTAPVERVLLPSVGSADDETLAGGMAGDRIDGRAGDDVILGGGGADVLSGAHGNDVLHGGPGADVLWAGPGRDVLLGGDGDDQLRASNLDGAVDRLHCGPGNDVAWVVASPSGTEDRTFGCERVVVVEVRRVRGGS